MKKGFDYTGVWWLPRKPEQKIAGRLLFHPLEGTRLDLIGSFIHPRDFVPTFQPEIILGVADGKPITLYKCIQTSITVMTGMANSVIRADVVFINHHFENFNDVLFNNVSVNYHDLEEWVGYSGFEVKTVVDDETKAEKYRADYKFPGKVVLEVGDFRISLEYEFAAKGDKYKEVNLNQTAFLKAESKVPLHFEVFHGKACYLLQSFLTLAMGRSTWPLVMKGKSDQCKVVTPDGDTFYQPIEIFYRVNELPGQGISTHRGEMLFTTDDIMEEFEECLRRWFSRAEILKPIYELYFGALYSSSMYLQHQFLSFVEALETYHRRTTLGKYVDENQFAAVYKSLVGAIPEDLHEDFKRSSKDRLRYLNEHSLRKRLSDLLILCDAELKPFQFQRDIFIEDVVSTRNFLIHNDPRLESRAKQNEDLDLLTQQVRCIVEICLLKELGLNQEKVNSIVSRYGRYRYLNKN